MHFCGALVLLSVSPLNIGAKAASSQFIARGILLRGTTQEAHHFSAGYLVTTRPSMVLSGATGRCREVAFRVQGLSRLISLNPCTEPFRVLCDSAPLTLRLSRALRPPTPPTLKHALFDQFSHQSITLQQATI